MLNICVQMPGKQGFWKEGTENRKWKKKKKEEKTENEDGEYERGRRREREIWRCRRKGQSVQQETQAWNKTRPRWMRRVLPERAVRNTRPAVP